MTTADAEIMLGDTCEDRTTGYKGLVVAITVWINNCRRITMQSKGLQKDGKPFETWTNDEDSIDIVELGPRHEHVPVTTGGPRNDPVTRRDPR